MKCNKLTQKQQLFIREYIKDFNATRSAIAAGYSEHTAARTGSENLYKPEIQKELSKRLKKRMDRVDIDADYVLKQLIECWESDIRDLFDDKDRLKPIREWPQIWGRMLGSVTVKKITAGFSEDDEDAIGKIVALANVDKTKFLKMLGEHTNVNAFKQVHEHVHKIEVSSRLSAAKKRMLGVTSEN